MRFLHLGGQGRPLLQVHAADAWEETKPVTVGRSEAFRLALPLLDQLYSDRGVTAAPAEDATTKGLARELVLRLAGARRRSPETGVQIADNA